MSKSNNLQICEQHLYTDDSQLSQLPLTTHAMILRIRAAYTLWNEYPNKKPKEIIAFITSNSKVDNATAWRDTKIIQELLGKINNPSKDWHRYKFNLMVTKAYDIAEIKQDPDAMQKAANTYAKYNQLDKDDIQAIPWDEIIPQLFIPTEDPSVIGIKPIPNVKSRIKFLLEKYSEDIQDITYDDIDINQLKNYADQ